MRCSNFIFPQFVKDASYKSKAWNWHHNSFTYIHKEPPSCNEKILLRDVESALSRVSHFSLWFYYLIQSKKPARIHSLHFFANVLLVHAKEARKIFVSKETLEYLVTFLTRSLIVWFIDWAASRITFMTRLPKISGLKSKMPFKLMRLLTLSKISIVCMHKNNANMFTLRVLLLVLILSNRSKTIVVQAVLNLDRSSLILNFFALP